MRLTVQEWNERIIEPLKAYYDDNFWYQPNGWIIGYRSDGSVGKLIPKLKEPGDRITKRDVENVQYMIYGHQGLLSGDDHNPVEDRWIRPVRLTSQLIEQIEEKLDRKLIRCRQVFSQAPDNIFPPSGDGENGWIFGADVIDFWSDIGMPSGYSFWSAGAIIGLLNHDTGGTHRQGSGTGSTITGTTLNNITSSSKISFAWTGNPPGGFGAEVIELLQATVAVSNSDFGFFEASSIATANFFTQTAGVPLSVPVTYTFEPDLAEEPFSETFPQLVTIPYRDDP